MRRCNPLPEAVTSRRGVGILSRCSPISASSSSFLPNAETYAARASTVATMQRGNILVFLEDGQISRATYITPDLLQPGEYSSSVRITADGYPALLQMSEYELAATQSPAGEVPTWPSAIFRTG